MIEIHRATLAPELPFVERRANDIERTVRTNIQRYNASKGGPPTAYHETVTRAWLTVVRKFVDDRGANARVEDAVAAFDKNHLERFYTQERLYSDEARVSWVEPDVAPF